jgi:hypothetical protein
MRKAFTLFLLLSAAACGGGQDSADESRSQDLKTFDVQEGNAPQASVDTASPAPGAPPPPPNVSPTAAPGVAFDYRYAFLLPARRISEVQEQHAAACEKLGTDKCRIISMQYERRGDEDIDAQLAFKLDPMLARRFGKEGIDAVTRAQGELTRAQITGTDVGTQIDEGQRSQAQIEEELKRIEQQLGRPGLSARERVELQQQAQSLRGSLRSGEDAQTARRAQLATTPMIFDYEAGETDRTVKAATQRSFERFLASLGTLLVILVYLLPWALMVLAGFLAWRWARRRFLKEPAHPAAEPPVTPPAG